MLASESGLTTAQLLFGTALGIVTIIITLFALYVLSTTVWSDRWFGRGK